MSSAIACFLEHFTCKYDPEELVNLIRNVIVSSDLLLVWCIF